MNHSIIPAPSAPNASPLATALRRRTFLRVAGASAASAALVLAGCSKDTPEPVAPPHPNRNTLQTGETGLLNYCFLFKQLQAAFYTKVVAAYPADFTAADKTFFADLHDHEVVQRQALLFALGNNYLPPLPFVFTSFTLTTRAGVLAAAQQLEDLGVAALVGALPLFSTFQLRVLLAKMLSVEGRHAALVRDLATPGTFAGPDVVMAGLSHTLTSTAGIAATAAFTAPIVISVANLPTV